MKTKSCPVLKNVLNGLTDEIHAFAGEVVVINELPPPKLLGHFDGGVIYSLAFPVAGISDGTPVLLDYGPRPDRHWPVPALVVGRRGAEVIVATSGDIGGPRLGCRPWGLRYPPDQVFFQLRQNLKGLEKGRPGPHPELLAELFPPADLKATATVYAARSASAILDQVLAQPVSFVWTPPGTDQAGFVGDCARRHYQLGHQVLLLNRSTTQVDVQSRLLGVGPGAVPIARVGAPLPEALPALEKYSLRELSRPLEPKLFAKIDRQEEAFNAVLRRVCGRPQSDAEYHSLLKMDWETFRLEAKTLRPKTRAAALAAVVLCPLVTSLFDCFVAGRQYDVVIISDAQGVLLPEILWAASLARKAVIITGEVQSAQPRIRATTEAAKLWVQRNIFEATGIVEAVHDGGWDSRLLMLPSQYNMPPAMWPIANPLSLPPGPSMPGPCA